tara:strand:- start:4844 stop:5419 length:576 start_codon:yes stop_codon:yes gene_type:complete
MQLIIFDLDGTLVDCKELHQAGFRWAVEQQVPGAEFNNEDVEGMPTTEKIRKLQQMGIPVTAEIDQIKKEHTRAHVEEYIKFNPQLKQLFDRLYIKYKLSLCSNSRSEFVFKCLNVLQLWQFESVFSRDYGPAKPDPWMYNSAMEISGVTPDQTIIFEDSPVGVEAAKRSGAFVIEVEDSQDLMSRVADLL